MTEYSSKQFMGSGTLKRHVFTSSGTFLVPRNVSSVSISGIAGGGAGCAVAYNSGNTVATALAKGGSGGEYAYHLPVQVSALEEIEVIIGAGGSPAATGNSYMSSSVAVKGGDGGDTLFGGYVILRGGEGGDGLAYSNSTSQTFPSPSNNSSLMSGNVDRSVAGLQDYINVTTNRSLPAIHPSYASGVAHASGGAVTPFSPMSALPRVNDAEVAYNDGAKPLVLDVSVSKAGRPSTGEGGGAVINWRSGNPTKPSSVSGAGASGILIVEWYE